jgi:hypothetical protein
MTVSVTNFSCAGEMNHDDGSLDALYETDWNQTTKARSAKSKKNPPILHAYFLFGVGAMIAARAMILPVYSSIVTLGAGIQCLGFATLVAKAQWQKSMSGISLKTLQIYAVVLSLRLLTTLTFGGYLPVDRSGDFVYQTADLISLGCVLSLLSMLNGQYKSTYQDWCDTMEIQRLIPGCIVFAVFIHGNLNANFLFDTLWTLSMNMDTIALLPQLWMLSKLGEVEVMTSHFVFALILSRTCSFAFWYYGYKELGRGRGPNLAGYQLLAAHALQLLLSLDFAYYYIVARIKGRRMVLPVNV